MPTYVMKAAKDRDLYVGWSTIVDGPVWVADGRDAALRQRDVAPDRLDRADATGTSVLWEVPGYPLEGSWDDTPLLVLSGGDYRGTLPRPRLVALADRLLTDPRAAYGDLLDPLDDTDEGIE